MITLDQWIKCGPASHGVDLSGGGTQSVITDDVAAAVLDSLPSRVAVLGGDGTVVRLNDAWRRSAAAGLAIVPVRPGTSWLAACDAAGPATSPLRALAALTRQMLNSRREQARVEIPVSTSRGERWMDIRIRSLSRGDGLVVVVDDVTERHGQEKALRHRAFHDPVTGLPNRSTLRDLINDALGPAPAPAARAASPPVRVTPDGRRPPSARAEVTAVEPPQPAASQVTAQPGQVASPGSDATGLAVFFLDLNSFHLVNQRFGYPAGDSVLRAAARRFRDVAGPAAVVGHWSGDQFVAVTTSTDEPTAAALADQLRICLTDPLRVDDHEIQLAVSVGFVYRCGLRSGHDDVTPPTKRSTSGVGGAAATPGSGPDADALVRMAGEQVMRAREEQRGGSDPDRIP